ncbi:hypothetical protein [Flavobacterium aureirubrum]
MPKLFFTAYKKYFYTMGRNNDKNIKAYNDKLHKAQDKAKAKKIAREELRKAIMKKFNEGKSSQ